MKKRLLALILCVMMLVSALPGFAAAEGDVIEVTNESAFLSAIASEGTKVSIKLMNDITISADKAKCNLYDKYYTIDLNGHNLIGDTSTQGQFLRILNGTLELTGKGTVKELTPDYRTIYLFGSTDPNAVNYSNLIVGKDVTIEGYDCIGITTGGDGRYYGITVTVNGTLNAKLDTSNVSGSGIHIFDTLKNTKGNVPQITLSSTSRITGQAKGIYDDGYAKWYLSGTIEDDDPTTQGFNALPLRQGDYTITGGTYTSTDISNDPAVGPYDSNKNSGAAICLASDDITTQKLNVTISGGTFISTNGCALLECIANNGTYAQGSLTPSSTSPAAASSYAALTVTGGRFIGASGKQAVKLNDMASKKVISGGYFSTDPSVYCVEGKTGVAYTGDSQCFFTVGEKTGETPVPAVVETVTVPASTASSDETVLAVAGEITGAEVTITEDSPITAAAKALAEANPYTASTMVGDQTVLEALNALSGMSVTEDTLAFVYEPYIDIVVEDAEKEDDGISSFTADLTPKYRVLATTKDIALGGGEPKTEGDGRNAVLLPGAGGTLTLPAEQYEIELVIPAGFASEGDSVSITHHKSSGGEEYITGTVVNLTDGKLAVRFVTTGFSEFDFRRPAAQIGRKVYPSLQAAADSAQDGDTIKLLKDGQSASVGRTVRFTVDRNGMGAYTITLGRYCTDRDAAADVWDILYSRPTQTEESSSRRPDSGYVPQASGSLINGTTGTRGDANPNTGALGSAADIRTALAGLLAGLLGR